MTDNVARILVPVDFSPHADRAFCYATTLAHRLGAQLGLLHVVDDPFASGAWTSEVYVPNVVEILDGLVDNATRRLARLKASAAALGLTAQTAVVTGRPVHTIVDYAAENGFDLIVMGTHGRSGLSHAVMGSVAEQVVRTAPCPVLTIRGAGAAVPAADQKATAA